MPVYELIQARSSDLALAATTIEYRRQWHAFRTLDRLEAALHKVRRQAPVTGLQPVANS